jgi:hypothetical protein
MYRIGLEFRKPLFTAMYDWREGGAGIAAPAGHSNVLEHCFGQAEMPTDEGRDLVSAEVGQEVSVATRGGNAEGLKQVVWRKKVKHPASPDSRLSSDNSGERREHGAATDWPKPELGDDPGADKVSNTAAMAQPESWNSSGGRRRSDIEVVVETEERAHAGPTGDNSNGTNWSGVVYVPELEGANDRRTEGIVGVTGSGAPRKTGAHFDCARVEKQIRATTVGRLVNELSVLKPQMSGEEREYARLSGSHPDFLTFRIAQLRPDLKQKVVVIRSSSKHIRLAQELAAAHYGKAVATIQDDWKRCKPPEFKLDRSWR